MARLFVAANSDYIDLGTGVRGNDLLGIMVSAWIKPTSLPGDQVVAGRWDNSVHEQWLLFVDAAGKLNWAILDTGFSGHVITGATAISTGVWTHVGGYFVNGGVQRCYVNGVQDATASPGVNLNQNNVESINAYIGRDAAGAYFNGAIAEVWIELVNSALASTAVYEGGLKAVAAYSSPTSGANTIPGSEFIRYYPLLGDSPEPEMAGHPGTSANATVHGTTVVDHPPMKTVTWGLRGRNAGTS